jgi:hypothetical protein
MSFSDAKILDADLRAAASTVVGSLALFKRLIAEAKERRIFVELGFKSWPAYVADVIGRQLGPMPVEHRRQVVEVLAGEGLSTRGIAQALKIGKSTVHRDLSVSRDGTPDEDGTTTQTTVTGLDGKNQPKRKDDIPPAERLDRALLALIPRARQWREQAVITPEDARSLARTMDLLLPLLERLSERLTTNRCWSLSPTSTTTGPANERSSKKICRPR